MPDRWYQVTATVFKNSVVQTTDDTYQIEQYRNKRNNLGRRLEVTN